MNPRKKTRLYVQLGRVGDILNILPLCKQNFDDHGRKPVLMVAEKFAAILEGVTYVEPLIFAGEFEETMAALCEAEDVAASRDLAIVCTQIYGKEIHCGEKCSSFVRESWARVPNAPAWGTLPLVFDRRDMSREVGIKNHLLQRGTGKPYVVLALAGTSSPFPENVDLMRYLRNKIGKTVDLVDVSGFMAPRFYDLLTLLEGAHALVTIDSALLHLAAAVPSLPVVAFITRTPSAWHGTAWRPQQVARFFYDEAPDCFSTVAWSVMSARAKSEAPCFLHAWSQAEELDAETERRVGFARMTWTVEKMAGGVWFDRQHKAEHAKRNSLELGDSRPVPFLKDLVEHAIDSPLVRHFDIVALTNADACFAPGLTGAVFDRVRRQGAAFTHRWDFPSGLERPLVNEEEVQRGQFYPGSDAFFFTVGWWRKHRDEYPDMLIGREQCDEVLRQLIKRHGGLEIPGAIYHEKHPSFWENPEQRQSNPGNQHNRQLARKWFLRTGYGPGDPTWWRLPAKPW